MVQQRRHSLAPRVVLLGALAVAALTGWRWHRKASHATHQEIDALDAKVLPNAFQADRRAAAQATSAANSLEPPTRGLQEICATLKNARDAKAARAALAELRGALAVMPPKDAAAAIQRLLDSKVDGPTYLGFKVGGSGFLDAAPTLRTFLLDELGRVDPAAAADYSKVVLASMDSPDDWALALRNLARGDSSMAGRALLEQKIGEMLHYGAWQQNPSVGFLESFDVAVYLGGTVLIPQLTELVRRQDNPAVARAAFLALDRLIINDPGTVLAALEADPALLQDREQTRANYFARVDVLDPKQRQLLETYLLSPKIGSTELDAFAGIYPNANYMISANLLTSTPTLDHAGLASRDEAALRTVQEWLSDPRFTRLSPQLQRIQQRLRQFVRQGN